MIVGGKLFDDIKLGVLVNWCKIVILLKDIVGVLVKIK